jgi:flagellin
MSVINTNVKALTAQASLSNVNKTMSTAMERLSTGSRINSAKDDAAGMAISLRMTSDIRGFAVAIRNTNDGISMAQTAEGSMGQVADMLQRMRELAVQSSNSSASADNRAASQLEVSQLKQEIDSISQRTNFNGTKLLDGSASKLTLQTGVNAGDTMTMKLASTSTKDIGVGIRSSLTATGLSGTATTLGKDLDAGDLVINGVTVGATDADDDLLSSGDKSSSAIAKVAAINLVSAQTGVTATVGETTVGGTVMAATALTGTITINGTISASMTTTADEGASRAIVVEAINAMSAQTGVRAVDTGDENKGVVLIADDGRNITLSLQTLTAAASGVGAAKVYTGTYQLTSTSGDDIVISGTTNGVLSNSGLSAGTFAANISAVSTIARAVGATTVAPSNVTTGVLTTGTMLINGTGIAAALADDDTASSTLATSSTKAASAIAIAAAINKSSDTTGVTAKADANVIVGTSFTAIAAASKALFVNGVSIAITTTTTSTLGEIAETINAFSGQTGVVASDNGEGLTLTAADGRNISLSSTGTAATDYGILSTAILATGGTAANAATTYAGVSLSSNSSFTLAAGADGNVNFELLGLRTGTVGGTDNGAKVSDIDVSTIDGAQSAITSLDAALKSVSLGQAELGAYQNRMEAVVSNLTVSSLNMSASRSRIQDTDYATESTNLAKAQIISQAATAMLAQANQSAQGVLALLK